MNLHVKDCYKQSDLKIPYNLFRLIVERFFLNLSNKIIQGEVWKIGFKLGDIRIRKIDRKFVFDDEGNITNLKINWAESRKLEKEILDKGGKTYDKKTGEGEKYLVYYDDPFYLRWSWLKSKCNVLNHTVYSFTPTSDNPRIGLDNKKRLGNKGKLVKANKENPNLHFRYEHITRK